MANAPWFITNNTLHNDLKIPFVLTELRNFCNQYLQRLSDHVKPLATALLNNSDDSLWSETNKSCIKDKIMNYY